MINSEQIAKFNLILASQSPRRRELIKGLDIEVTIAESYEVDETVDGTIEPSEVPKVLSEKKSKEYPFELLTNDVLITSDTVVWVDGMVLGKPIDRANAIEMLQTLSAKEHKVVTAVTLRNGEIFYTFSQTTKVKFKEITLEDIEYYVDKYEPYDKAGAYAIQQWIGYVAIESIEGSFYNVMGLPVCSLYQELDNFINKLNR